MWCTFSFVHATYFLFLIDISISTYISKSVDCCNDRFLYHHQSTNPAIRTYFVDVNSLNESNCKRVIRSRTLYLQVLVWTQSSSTSNHRRYVPTMAVNLPPHAMLGVDGVRCMTRIDFKLQQLLVPTMRLFGNQWHSSGGCLAGGIVHRT